MKLNKKQKRTATIASMAALLAVVLGMGGQTFAKYITTDNATAQATVAKWGYVVNVNVDELFGTKYGVEDDTPADKMLIADASGTAVVAGGKTAVVAPGTEGSATVVVTGSAEVKSSLTFTVTTAKDAYVGSHKPIKWTVTESSVPSVGSEAIVTTPVNGKTLADVETYFEGLSQASIAAGTYINKTYTISWGWAFHVDDATDILDTQLGDLASFDAENMTEAQFEGKYGVKPSSLSYYTGIDFTLSVGVEQIQ